MGLPVSSEKRVYDNVLGAMGNTPLVRLKRIGRDRFVRNVMIAIGNSGDPYLIPSARNLLDDQAAEVRAMAVWALSRPCSAP